jgi:hypothetical protein
LHFILLKIISEKKLCRFSNKSYLGKGAVDFVKTVRNPNFYGGKAEDV